MTLGLADYIEAGKRLSVEERLRVAHELLVSAHGLGENETSGAEWLAELDGRAHDTLSGAVVAVDGEEAQARIRAELASRRR